jgi:hypothetical protein
MALSYLEFEQLVFLVASIVLAAFTMLDNFIIVEFPFRDVSLLDILL